MALIPGGSSWASADGPRPAADRAFGRSDEHPEPPAPPLREDLRAGLLTVVVTLLLGAPVGLLWSVLAPAVPVLVVGQELRLAEPYDDGLIALDGYFLAAAWLAGLVGGSLAWWRAERHGPAVVVGLAVGGLAAARVAQTVGEERAREALRAAVAAGGDGRYDGLVELGATGALAAWPLASLVTWCALSLAQRR